jgi:hypothetical protein
VDELRDAFGLDPLAEEGVGNAAKRRTRISGQVLGLDRGLPRADEHPAVVIDGYEDR